MSDVYVIQCASAADVPEWLKVISVDSIDTLVKKDVDYFLVDTDDCSSGYQTLEAIRANPLPEIYLKPVVLLKRSTGLPEEFLRSFDNIIDSVSLNENITKSMAASFDPINRWISNLGPSVDGGDTNLALKVVRYFASRLCTAEAFTTLQSRRGYIYPLLEPFFSTTDGSVLTTLEFLEQQHILEGQFQTKARFCSQCESAFLNFKEVCTHCGSEDLSVDELVHHFKCGYTAELSDFRRGDELVCPKCDRTLKHIGVDYDKPSIMHRCNSCSNPFQEPDILTSCFNCGKTSEPENLLYRNIKQYRITSIGIHAAIFGLESLFERIIEDDLQLVSYSNFIRFVSVESARIERYKLSESTLLLFYLKGLSTMYTRLGARAEEMFKEISTIIRSILRTSDVITAKDGEIFFVLLTETSLENAERAVERMRLGVSEIIEENIGGGLELISDLHEIIPAIDANQLLEEFLEHQVD